MELPRTVMQAQFNIPRNAGDGRRTSRSPHPPRPPPSWFDARVLAPLFFKTLLVVGLFLFVFLYFKDQNDELRKRVRDLEKKHDAEQAAAAPDGLEFEQLFNQARAQPTEPTLRRFGNSAVAIDHAQQRQAQLPAVADDGHVHTRESHYYSFVVPAEKNARVPASGGIKGLSTTGLLTFSVCCSTEAPLQHVCVGWDQIGVIVRINSELDEAYLRVQVFNDMFAGKQCIFYWVREVPAGTGEEERAA